MAASSYKGAHIRDGMSTQTAGLSREDIRTSYNRMSRWYDILVSSEQKFTEEGLKKLQVIEGETVLEVGFGTGRSLVVLAHSVGETGKVYGIDLSENMVKIALSRVKKERLQYRVVVACGDAAELPFEEDFFDAIFMSFILEIFDSSEIPAVLKECWRVLHHEGRLCVVALSRKETSAVKLYEWIHRKFPKYVNCRPINAEKMLRAADFCIIEVAEKSLWGLPVETVLARKS